MRHMRHSHTRVEGVVVSGGTHYVTQFVVSAIRHLLFHYARCQLHPRLTLTQLLIHLFQHVFKVIVCFCRQILPLLSRCQFVFGHVFELVLELVFRLVLARKELIVETDRRFANHHETLRLQHLRLHLLT